MSDIVVLTKAVLYTLISVLGLFISVPVGVTSSRFHGACLLYGSAEQTGHRLQITGGSAGNCNFITSFHVIVSVLAGAVMAVIYYLLFFYRNQESKFGFLQTFIVKLVLLILQAGITFLCLVTACMLTVGFRNFCSSVTALPIFTDCSSLQSINWEVGDGSSFHLSYTIAMAALWIIMFLWGAQAGLTAWEFIRNLNNPDPEPAIKEPTDVGTIDQSEPEIKY